MRAFNFAKRVEIVAAVCLVATACGGGGGGMVIVTNPDGGADAVDARVGVTCPGAVVVGGTPRGLGACCVANTDCAGGVCWDGFCTKTCATTAECGPAVAPSPLPVGTPMACAPNQLADGFSFCLPGSLAACSPGTCPAGETCALGLDPAAVPPAKAASGSYAGACLTKLMATPFLPVGSACEPEQGPYACENQGGYLGSACVGRRCTQACRVDKDCPYGTLCGPPPFSATEGGVASFVTLADVGICQGRMCGQVHGQAGLPTGQATQQGADAVCPTGEICVPTGSVGAAGDTAYLSCVPSRAGAVAYGMPCGKGAAAPNRCADDALCVSRGGAPATCSSLCRADADCPTGSFCMDDFVTTALPNGSVAKVAMCVARAAIAGTACHGEKDCPATQTCLPAGGRSGLLLCQPAVGTKDVGAPCAAPAECRGGACVDRDLHIANTVNRATCGGYCGKNSDCGTGQICLTVITNNNLTTDNPLDDVTVGYCTTLDAPARNGACHVDADCLAQSNPDEMGGDTCDPVHLTCYKRAATIGAACAHRAECPLGAYCRSNDPRFTGGACLSLGCDPAAVAGVDACPAGSVCTQRPADRPLFGCYESCGPQQRCSREAEGYSCDLTGTTAAAPICRWNGGT